MTKSRMRYLKVMIQILAVRRCSSNARRFFYLAVVASLAASGSAAQTQPDAGAVTRNLVPMPVRTLPGSNISFPQAREAADQSASSAVVPVSAVRIVGVTAFDLGVLTSLVGDVAHRSVSVVELQLAVARITAHYRAHGYFASWAYLPQQRIEDGVVTIGVVEGRLERVHVQNESRVSTRTVNDFIQSLEPGSLLRQAPTNRLLLLMSDLPGVGMVDSQLASGSDKGESLLIAGIGSAPLLSGRVEADNFGGLYTGRNRFIASVDLNSAFGFGERYSARVMGSNDNLLYGRLAYQMPMGGNGWTAGAAVGYTAYELGSTFASLDAIGRSTVGEFFVRYPIVRGMAVNLNVQTSLEFRKLRDEIRSTSTVTEKHAQALVISVTGDLRDALIGGGATQGSVALTGGRLAFDSAVAESIDAVGARTAGGYGKLMANVERQQQLTSKLYLVGNLRTQWTNGNLDSSEKFSLGGPGGVRAYPTSEGSGDRGWLGTLELRYTVAPWLTLSAFHDVGRTWVNASPFLSTPNEQNRSGSGVGASGVLGDFDWRAFAAWRNSEVGTAEPDERRRFWLQAGWRF